MAWLGRQGRASRAADAEQADPGEEPAAIHVTTHRPDLSAHGLTAALPADLPHLSLIMSKYVERY
jgi:hypothetical protein